MSSNNRAYADFFSGSVSSHAIPYPTAEMKARKPHLQMRVAMLWYGPLKELWEPGSAAIPGGGWRLRAVLSDPTRPGNRTPVAVSKRVSPDFSQGRAQKTPDISRMPGVSLLSKPVATKDRRGKPAPHQRYKLFVPSALQKGCPKTEEIPQKRHARGRRASWINNYLWIPAFRQ